jgi:hypothetical protein
MGKIYQIRHADHSRALKTAMYLMKGHIPSIADVSSKGSIRISEAVITHIGISLGKSQIEGQKAGKIFEQLTRDFLEEVFTYLKNVRPGKWRFSVHEEISDFAQYKHLGDLTNILKGDVPKDTRTNLKSLLGDYLVTPDVVVSRTPLADSELDRTGELLKGGRHATFTPLRQSNSTSMILHASISCKLTMRSDRAQNARTEALNLIRNRKGNTPHISVVTAEPLPSRIASVALGTGDIDCVYHFALPELQAAVQEKGNETDQEQLDMMINGRRLRDISDLPFDLAI